MSIYFAHRVDTSKNQSVSPAVKDRGLSHCRAKPSDVQISVLPLVTQPGYACYLMNLPAFIEATLTGKTVAICNRGYPIGQVPYDLPFALPGVIYDFNVTPTDRKKEQLLEHSVMIDGKSKSPSFVMQDPTLDKLRELVIEHPTVNQTTAHVYGVVNLKAARMAMVICRILSAFLLTHVYPAFRHETDIAPTRKVGIEIATKKRKVSTTSYVACMSNPVEHIEEPVAKGKEEVEEGEMQDGTYDIQLSYAKPSKVIKDKWGLMDNIPNSSGIYAPYVKELAVSDPNTVPNLLNTYFLRSLASDAHGMFDTMERIKSAWGLISTTDFGNEVTHFCKCIEIALTAQATVYPVFYDEVYEGTVICGTGYSINFNGEVLKPLAYAELQEVVSKSSSHTVAIKNIERVTKYDLTGVTTIRELSDAIKGAKLDDLARQEVVKDARKLSFRGRYWSTSAFHIKQMMALLSSDKEIPVDTPMHPDFIFTSDRIESVLSAFGHQAPSLMIPNGKKCDLNSKEPPTNFMARTVATKSAVADMKWILENGSITNNINTLSSNHRDTSLKSNIKTEVWNNLLTAYKNANPNNDSKPAAAPRPISGKSIEDDLF